MSDSLGDRLARAVADQYRLGAELGRGGMGVVYAARDLRLDRQVALKVLPRELALSPEVRARFLREARTAARLAHPNIVPIHAVDERDGVAFFVMSLVEGETLAQRLGREPVPPLADTVRIITDVADALWYAHASGVVHRDVKPDNILVERGSGRPMVTDFGIARAGEVSARLTATGATLGTPAYMSPEQASGDSEIDGRADIYSLGVIAYQMLAGRTPFSAANQLALLMKHVSEDPRPLRELRPDLPPGVCNAVDRALRKQRGQRWPDAAAFRDALRAGAAREGWQESRPGSARAGDADNRSLRKQLAGMSGRDPDEWFGGAMGESRRAGKRRRREARLEALRNETPEQALRRRVTSFRRRLWSHLVAIGGMAVINLLTTGFLWFLIPAFFMVMGLITQAGALWADGVPLRELFAVRKRSVEQSRDAGSSLPRASSRELERLAPPDVLAGRHGEAIRRAVEQRLSVRTIVATLPRVDRAMIPDVSPTVDALVDRVASIANMLHRVDGGASPEMLEAIDARIAALAGEPPTPERDRRAGLLERQRASLTELLKRRDTLFHQLESAMLALETLRLDLLRLRSAGVQAAIGDVNTATREARALTNEIGSVLEAAAEIRAG